MNGSYDFDYVVIGSATQAVARVALRVKLGGHDVPETDVRRRFERSRRHWLEDYLPLADQWGAWDNQTPPAMQIASSQTHTLEELHAAVDGFERLARGCLAG